MNLRKRGPILITGEAVYGSVLHIHILGGGKGPAVTKTVFIQEHGTTQTFSQATSLGKTLIVTLACSKCAMSSANNNSQLR
jgi:hypothetical protein